ncbi:MAG TPA: DUF935 family protein [Pirellulales bacterium]|nr:DUF935 family protein [Pirellulales bacterium]
MLTDEEKFETPVGAVELDPKDPAAAVPGMAPNFGRDVTPHVATFVGIVSSFARVYRPSDEAIKHSWDNARFMLNDPMVMECVEQRQRSVSLLNWHLEPEDANDPAQKEMADELTRIIKRIPRFMQYRESLQRAIWCGKYANTHRFGWRRLGGRMRLHLERWRPLHGDKLVFGYDDWSQTVRERVGIRVGAGFQLGSKVADRWPVEKFKQVEPTDQGLAYFLNPWERPLLAIHKHLIEDGEFEDPQSAGKIHGIGIRSRIYWAWYQKQETLAFLMDHIERTATGIEIWYYPWGNEEARKRTEQAATERVGEGRNIILVPRPVGDDSHSYGVDRIEPSAAGVEILKEVIEKFFGHQIKRYILGQTMTTEAGPAGLGSSQAEVHMDTYMQIVRYDATNAEETLTTDLVEPLKLFNCPHMAEVPVYFRIDTEAPDVESKLKAWKDAFDMGMEIKEQDLMDLVGASKPSPDDRVLSRQQQAQIDQASQGSAPGMGDQGANDRPSVFGMPRGDDADKVWAALQANRQRGEADDLDRRADDRDDAASDSKDYSAASAQGTTPSENSERRRVETPTTATIEGAPAAVATPSPPGTLTVTLGALRSALADAFRTRGYQKLA